MRKNNELVKLYNEAKSRYINKGLDFNKKSLLLKINGFYRESKEGYLKLLGPKIVDSTLYTNIWVWEEIGKDIANISVEKPFKFNSPPIEYKYTVEFLKRYPAEYVKEIKNKNVKMTEELLVDMEKRFLDMVGERSKFSLNKGYTSRLEMYLENYKIPRLEYKNFLKKVDQVILNCNYKLVDLLKDNTELSRHCFICESKNFPFKKEVELLKLFGQKYPILGKYIHKIKIVLGDGAEAKYIKENDSFIITLDKKVKPNHQMMDLIHELAHVILYLENFKKGENILKNGRYFIEKLTTKIEFNFLKKYFPQLFVAKLGTILHNIWLTLFEIELYKNPDKNHGEICAKCHNRCFLGANKKINYGYLLNNDILYDSFLLLPYVVADVNILENQLDNN